MVFLGMLGLIVLIAGVASLSILLSYEVRVPVPYGKEGEAEQILAYFTEGRPMDARG